VYGGGLLAGLRPRLNLAAWQYAVPVPPSVMLHARQEHLDNLPALVDWLLARAYTPITYRMLWDGLTAGGVLPRNPAIVSVDDLSLVRGSSNFAFIEKMVDVFIEKEALAVIAINTEPVVLGANNQPVQLTDQDSALWARAQAWTAQGIELATHTQSHQNLTDASLTADDYRREIGGSAQMIADRTGQPVTTLVLPYGNGTLAGHDGALMPRIVDECRRVGIGMVVGVAGGRVPLTPAPAESRPVYLVGRVGPVRGDFSTIYGDIEYWHGQNAPGDASDLP
jgi:peptidoglycan/xylan/chitin deacetylase (PgdA/CDA1 family)